MKRYVAVATAVMAAGLVPAVASASPSWQVTQLTSGPYNDAYPEISGSNVIWQRQRETQMGTYVEICFYDGSQTRQLTNNLYAQETMVAASISGSHAAWDSIDPYGISYFDGTKVTSLSAPGGYYHNIAPSISGTNVAWYAELGDTHDIFLYSGGEVKKLSNGGWNGGLSVSGNHVVWSGRAAEESYAQIYLYDGSSIAQLTHSPFSNYNPQVSGSNVAWTGRVSSGTELFLYDGTSIAQLTHGNTSPGAIQIDGGSIVWQASDGTDEEIYLYRNGSITQLTNNNYDDYSPDVSGKFVTWTGKDEVFVYDGMSTSQLTNTGYANYGARVDGTTVVWEGGTASGNRIFVATLVPEPGTIGMLGLGALSLLRRKW